MTDKTYEDGVRDGRIKSLEDIAAKCTERLNMHEQWLIKHDRFMWVFAGVVVTVETIAVGLIAILK